jgi:hypothetical protein
MGITGLLPLLKPIHNQTHVKEFAGKTIAVDGYVWLHRAAYSCAMDLVKGKRTSKCVYNLSLQLPELKGTDRLMKHPFAQIRGLCDASHTVTSPSQDTAIYGL